MENKKTILLEEIHKLLDRRITLEEIFEEHRTGLSQRWNVHDAGIGAESHQNYSEFVVKSEETLGFLYFFSLFGPNLDLTLNYANVLGWVDALLIAFT